VKPASRSMIGSLALSAKKRRLNHQRRELLSTPDRPSKSCSNLAVGCKITQQELEALSCASAIEVDPAVGAPVLALNAFAKRR
jgi:hypothetical protein